MVNKDIIKGIYQGIGILLVFSFLGLVYAGGYHLANEILPGQFKTGNYMFNGSVQFGDDVSACSSTNEGATKYDKTGKTLMYCNSSDWVEIGTQNTMHMARMSRNATQSIPTITETKILFDNEDFDIGGIGNIETDKFEISNSGKYLITGSWGLSGKVDSGETIEVFIKKNGATIKVVASYSSVTNSYLRITATEVIELQSGDYIEMYVKHNEGSAQSTEPEISLRPTMSVVQLS